MDRFRREKLSDMPYRFFPNRTRKQTFYCSWIILGITCVMTWVAAGWYDKQQNKIAEELEKQWHRTASPSTKVALEAQNSVYQEMFLKARRKTLGLPEKSKGLLEIRDIEEEEEEQKKMREQRE